MATHAICDHCKTFVAIGDTKELGGVRYCGVCVGALFARCVGCGRLVSKAKSTRVDDSGHYACRDCRKQFAVKGYSYKPSLRFHAGKDEDLTAKTAFFGVENEVIASDIDTRNTAADALFSQEFLYAKRDGSITDNGIEFVSHPFTLQWAKENAKAFSPMLTPPGFSAGKWQASKTNKCGVHVHVSRSTFDNIDHQARFAWFWSMDQRWTLKISGRNDAGALRQWAGFESSYFDASENITRPTTRYRACNATNRNTLEVRIFNGRLGSHNNLLRCIEVVAAAVEYTRQVRDVRRMDIEDFAMFVSDRRDTYRHLAAWMIRTRQIAA